MRTSSVLKTSIRLRGKTIPGAADRQGRIAGFDQEALARSKAIFIGAGGLTSHIAPTLARKGVGAIALFDDDIVELSNLNRQLFYEKDLGVNKALALAENLQRECVFATEIAGHAVRFEEAIEKGLDLNCDVAVCAIDNNPGRIAAARYFCNKKAPVIFTAISADADHGYVFVQEKGGPCLGCLFPDAVNSNTFPCPGTPAIAEILQAVGAMAVYAIDTCLMARPRQWNYRHIFLADGQWDGSSRIKPRSDCPLMMHTQ